MTDVAYRVIADHIRTLTFAITDGATPDKEGRGYVLRRILRRAVRYGWQYLNVHEPFLCKLVPAVVDAMGEAFPELRVGPDGKHPRDNTKYVAGVLRNEEESFGRTLERGIALFEEAAEYAVRSHHGEIRGEDAFKLHDTFGFPIDLTEIMASERGLRVDIGEYERLMELARDRARFAGKTPLLDMSGAMARLRGQQGSTQEQPTDDSAKYVRDSIVASIRDVWRFDSQSDNRAPYSIIASTTPSAVDIRSGERAIVILDRTCFYAEQGGQVGDRGRILNAHLSFRVQDTIRADGVVVHLGSLVSGQLRRGDEVTLVVDAVRAETEKNHTATHVMNWALREVLDPAGAHLQQKGSLVDPEKTRFDFSHPKPVTPAEIERIETLCAGVIRRDLPVFTNENVPVAQKDAMNINGLRAVFGEKYPDQVRVVSIGVPITETEARAAGRSDWLLKNPDNPDWRKYSVEFCGGTHVKSTGQIEHFVLTHEEAVAKGVRRLVGVSGQRAKLIQEAGAAALLEAEALRSGPGPDMAARVARLQKDIDAAELPIRDRQRLRDVLAELGELVKQQQKSQAAQTAGVVNAHVDGLLAGAPKVGATTVFVAEMPDVPIDQLKSAADRIKQKCGSAAILLGVRQGSGETGSASEKTGQRPVPQGKALLLAAMTDDVIKRGLKAGDIIKNIAPIVEGGGGGPPTMAQAGGKNSAKLMEALSVGERLIREKLR